MQTCAGFFWKPLLEYAGDLQEICSVKFVDTLSWGIEQIDAVTRFSLLEAVYRSGEGSHLIMHRIIGLTDTIGPLTPNPSPLVR